MFKRTFKLREHVNFLAVFIGFSFVIWTFFPGLMSGDAVWQLEQARTGNYTFWHPPMMAWVWGLFDRIVPGPLGIFLLHNCLFWTGVFLIVSLCVGSNAKSFFIIILVALFPPIFLYLANVCKDVGMAAALLCSFGLFLYCQKNKSIGMYVSGLVILFYAFSLRHNAVMAVLPFVFWASLILTEWMFPNRNKKSRTRFIICVLILVGFFLIRNHINHTLVFKTKAPDTGHNLQTPIQDYFENDVITEKINSNQRLQTPLQQILVYDLLTVSIEKKEVYLPGFISPQNAPFTMDQLKNIYRPRSIHEAYWGVNNFRKIPYVINENQAFSLIQKWFEVIPANLDIYIPARMLVFRGLMGWNFKHVRHFPFEYSLDQKEMVDGYRPTFMYRLVLPVLDQLKHSMLFRGWVYLAVVVLSMVFFIIFRKNFENLIPISVLISSALLYILPFFFFDVDGEFRYNLWTIYTVVALMIIMPVSYRVKSKEQ